MSGSSGAAAAAPGGREPQTAEPMTHTEIVSFIWDVANLRNYIVGFSDGMRRSSSGSTSTRVPVKRAILAALSERDPGASVCHDKNGSPAPDLELRTPSACRSRTATTP